VLRPQTACSWDVAIAKATRQEERRATLALGGPFPQVNVISVREQLEAVADLFDRLALAIRGASRWSRRELNRSDEHGPGQR